MIGERFTRDAAHGQLVPTGSSLATVVRGFLANDFYHFIRSRLSNTSTIDPTRLVAGLEAAANPFIIAYVRRGRRQQAAALLRQFRLTKSLGGYVQKSIDFSFALFRPEISDYVKSFGRVFAESTLKTALTDVETTYKRFMEELDRSLIAGETQVELNRRIVQILNDPFRAARAAQTEAHRAMHAGQYAVDEQSGVAEIEWLASSDACKACLKLNGQRRPIGVPFVVKTTGPEAYRKVFFPGLHPLCQCSYKAILKSGKMTPQTVEMLKREARTIA